MAILATETCEPLLDLFLRDLRAGPIINMDETCLQVLHEAEKSNNSTSYTWVARGGPEGQVVVLFRYDPSQEGQVAEEIFGTFLGYLQTDGYVGYEALGAKDGIVHVVCMAQVRRKFLDVLKAVGKKTKPGVESTVMDMIGKLYFLENNA